MSNLNKLSLLLILFTGWQLAFAQKDARKVENDQRGDGCLVKWNPALKKNIYDYVDKMPDYPGGTSAMLKFISKNYKLVSEKDFQGTIKIDLIIDEKGHLVNLGIFNKKLSDISIAEKEALKVFKRMPIWRVGKCNGTIVPVHMVVPIRF